MDNRTFPVAIRPGDTPVPIPNTMVKTWEADDTMLETAWESRWLPESLLKRGESSVEETWAYGSKGGRGSNLVLPDSTE